MRYCLETVRVWAPEAGAVRLQLDGVEHPMRRNGGGNWSVRVDAGQGARYGFLVDDDPTVLPDPRSAMPPASAWVQANTWPRLRS